MSGSRTVRDALDDAALARGLRPSTLLSHRRFLAQAGLLDLLVSEVTALTIHDALWSIETPSSRRSAAIAVRTALGVRVVVPRVPLKPRAVPTVSDARFALCFTPYAVRGLLMLYAGLRIGEACAATSQDIALGQKPGIDVHRQVIELHETGRPVRLGVSALKTATSTAFVSLPLEIAERAKNELPSAGFVRPSVVRESFRRAGKKAGVILRPHDLRRACATHLLRQGVPLPAVSRHLRHSDIQVTLKGYVAWNDGDVRAAFE